MAGAVLAQDQPTDVQRKSSWAAYHSQLNATCAKNQIQNLTPGDLNYFIEGFESKMPATQSRRFQEASQQACKGSAGGVACANSGFLMAAQKESVLDGFCRLNLSQRHPL